MKPTLEQRKARTARKIEAMRRKQKAIVSRHQANLAAKAAL